MDPPPTLEGEGVSEVIRPPPLRAPTAFCKRKMRAFFSGAFFQEGLWLDTPSFWVQIKRCLHPSSIGSAWHVGTVEAPHSGYEADDPRERRWAGPGPGLRRSQTPALRFFHKIRKRQTSQTAQTGLGSADQLNYEGKRLFELIYKVKYMQSEGYNPPPIGGLSA